MRSPRGSDEYRRRARYQEEYQEKALPSCLLISSKSEGEVQSHLEHLGSEGLINRIVSKLTVESSAQNKTQFK